MPGRVVKIIMPSVESIIGGENVRYDSKGRPGNWLFLWAFV